MDHFRPNRPGVTPGLQDHSYTSVWCNTRPLEPPLPPSGELVPNNTPLGIPWNCAANSCISLDHTPGITPGLEDHLSEVLLGILPTPVALPDETRPLGFYLPRDFSERPYLYQTGSQSVCVCVTLLKDRMRRMLLCFVSENSSIFPSDLVGKPILYHLVSKVCVCV